MFIFYFPVYSLGLSIQFAINTFKAFLVERDLFLCLLVLMFITLCFVSLGLSIQFAINTFKAFLVERKMFLYLWVYIFIFCYPFYSLGLSIQFAINTFKAFLVERDMSGLKSALKKAQLDSRLLELLPINKRTQENFNEHFKNAGLEQICEYQVWERNTIVRGGTSGWNVRFNATFSDHFSSLKKVFKSKIEQKGIQIEIIIINLQLKNNQHYSLNLLHGTS